MIIKLDENRQAYLYVENGDLFIECNGDLKIKEVLKLNFFYGQTNSKTRYELEAKIEEYKQKIKELKDIEEAYKVTLAIYKYKENEAEINIKEHQDFPFCI